MTPDEPPDRLYQFEIFNPQFTVFKSPIALAAAVPRWEPWKRNIPDFLSS
jgi:hypothetical protein